MHFQDWLRSLRTSAEFKGSDSESTRLWPSLPSSSISLSSVSLSSLFGLGAVASLAAYYLVMRPRPMLPPCDLQAQSVPVDVSAWCQLCAGAGWERVTVLMPGVLSAGGPQLQTIGSSQRRFAAGVLLRGHQDVLRHVPARTQDRRYREESSFTTHAPDLILISQ